MPGKLAYIPKEVHVIDDVATLQVVADPLRLRLLEQLRREPQTVKQLAAALDVAQTKLYYHIKLLEEHDLPLPWSGGAAQQIVSEPFMQSLLNAPDDESLRQLIEERARLLRLAGDWASGRGQRRGPRPQSRDQESLLPIGARRRPRNSAEFAAAVRGR